MRIPLKTLSQRGFTLIEAMIGLALASIITVGLTQLFVANAQTYNLLSGQSLMQDSGRFLMEYMSRDAQRAGYKGCFSSNEELYKSFLDTVEIPYEFDLNVGLIGYEGLSGNWAPNIETVLPKTVGGIDTNVYLAGTEGAGKGINTNEIVRGTDIVTFRYISRVSNRVKTNMGTSAEAVDVENTSFEFAADYLAYIHDCEKGTIFRVTAINGDSDIEHGDATDSDGFTNVYARLAEFNTYETDAYVNAIVTKTYFIAPGTDMNDQDVYPLSLWQKIGISAPQEIVEGVEDLQIKYGVDTDNDDIPNKYFDADGLAIYLDDVVTIRISITTNSVNDVGGRKEPTHGCISSGGSQYCLDGEGYDGLLRRTFTQTVALRNQS